MSAADTEDRPRSSRPSPDGFVRRVLIVAAILSGLVLVWRIADVVPIIFGGILLAIALRGLSAAFVRLTGIAHALALSIVILTLLAALGTGGWLLGDRLAGEILELTNRLPAALDNLRATIDRWPAGQNLLRMLTPRGGDAAALGARLGSWVSTSVGAVADAVLMLGIGLYSAFLPELYRRGFVRLFPLGLRAIIDNTLDALTQALREWLLGQLITMVAVGIMITIGLWLIGVPLALTLGILAAMVEFIPYLGPLLASVPGILLGFTQGPMTAVYAMVVYLLAHQVENHLLQPLIQRWATRLPPALGIAAVAIFGVLFGVIGVLFAVPAMVVVMVLVERLYIRRIIEADRPGPE